MAHLLVSLYPKGEADNPEAFITAASVVLAAYPLSVVNRVVDPLNGLPGRLGWFPKLADIRKACEAEIAPMRRAVEMARHREAQLLERETVAREAADWTRPSYEDICRDMAARGMPLKASDKTYFHGETPESVMAKYNIPKEVWDKTPDQSVESSCWKALGKADK